MKELVLNQGFLVYLNMILKVTESWGDSTEEDDDEDDDDNDGNDDDDSDHERTESDRDENPNLNQSNDEHEEEEDEYVDEFTDKENDADNAIEENEEELDDAEELYKDVNGNLRKEYVEMIDAYQSGVEQHNVSQESGFELDKEDAHVTLTVTSTLYNVPVTVIPEFTSAFTTTIPPPPPSFNPPLQQATPTASEVTTSFLTLPNIASVFRFKKRVTNLERDLSEMKQVDQYAQAISLIPAIIDRYIDNKQREAIQQAIQSHTAECREEALADRREYIDLIDTSRNVTESLEVVVLAKSSSQPKSSYEAVALLSEFELTKILMDMMEEHKSYLRADYKRELYDALVKSYNTDKDLFDTYGEVFTLKRSRDDKDKDQDPSAGSDRGMKRRKSSKDAESSRDPKSKESKSTSSSKGTSRSQHKSSGKSAHVEEPSHIVDDSGVQQTQEFDTGNNDEQPDDMAVSKSDWYKKPEQPPTPDPDWNKRQQVDFRPSQTWISNLARAEKPPTSFDELMDTPIDFSAFVMNRLNIANLTQELLVGPVFNLLKGTCKSRTELEYHFKECFKATTERLDWHNPEGKQYPFDLRKPLLLILNHRGRHVVYDKHAYWGTSHWGPKRQKFYGFASNMPLSKDVYSRKRIIAVTSLKIMKWFRKVKYYEDEDDYFTDFKTEFPAIVFDNTLTSDTALPCEPTISPPNENKIDFRISLDKSDDEDYTVIFDEYSFSYKIISINDLKKDSENYEILKPSSSEPTVDYLDDLDYFNNFENEFPAIVSINECRARLKPDSELNLPVDSRDEAGFAGHAEGGNSGPRLSRGTIHYGGGEESGYAFWLFIDKRLRGCKGSYLRAPWIDLHRAWEAHLYSSLVKHGLGSSNHERQ
ncbi:hypothetical protein Tco_0417865 [Tanacetum coccineum]